MINKILFHMHIIGEALKYRIQTNFTRKEKNTWVFGAWKGNSYSDNTRYLFEYTLQHHPEINAYWVTKNEKIFKYLKELRRPVLLYPSKEADRVIATASFLFQTEGYKDTGEYPVGRAKVIQLWHGISCKAFNWFSNYSLIQKLMILVENGNRKEFYWTSTSRFYTVFFERVFNVPERRFLKCGYPRCDSFVVNKQSSLVTSIKSKGFRYVGLYLPTHRNWGADFDNTFVVNGLQLLDSELENSKICLIFKPHPNEVSLFSSAGKSFKNIIVLNGNTVDEADVYQYLYKCDFLVSDYSSVIYDYLIVNKPIILFPYDLERYQKEDGGLIEEYFSKPVGPMVNTWKDLSDMLRQLLETDDWQDRRMDAYRYFNEYNNDNNCESLIEMLKSL